MTYIPIVSPIRRGLAVLAAAALFWPAGAAAQDAPAAPPKLSAFSLTVGGAALGESRLVLGKAAYERGHFALSAEATNDQVTEARAGRAEDFYRLRGGSLAARYYSRAPGRGLFAEVGGSYARTLLRSTDDAGTRREETGSVPLLSYGGGVRLGRTGGGVFAEVGLRTAVFLRELHLHTDDAPPAGSRDEMLSERSWFFERGGRSSQLYLGVGVSL